MRPTAVVCPLVAFVVLNAQLEGDHGECTTVGSPPDDPFGRHSINRYPAGRRPPDGTSPARPSAATDSESAPRWSCTTSTAVPPRCQSRQPPRASPWSAGLPTRIGGFDQIEATATSAGTSSGGTRSRSSIRRATCSPPQPTGPCVDVDGQHRAPGPASRRECDRPGAASEVERASRAAVVASASRSRSEVPVSRCPWLNTPRSVPHRERASGSATSIVRRPIATAATRRSTGRRRLTGLSTDPARRAPGRRRTS